MDFDWAEAERHWSVAMPREPVSHDVLLWYANHFLLPTGRVGEAVAVESNVIDNDPLNLLYRHHLALSLWHAGRLRDAEAELRRVLAVDDRYPLALNSLGALYAQQGQFEGALQCAEAAYSLAPLALFGGHLAAVLRRTGATSRADSLVEGLRSGTSCGASVGLTVYYGLLGQFAEAAECAERAIEERYTMLIQVIRPLLRSSTQWPALARRMNIHG
jgi:tetratricopeptide (TPR) repeat protein